MLATKYVAAEKEGPKAAGNKSISLWPVARSRDTPPSHDDAQITTSGVISPALEISGGVHCREPDKYLGWDWEDQA